MFILGSLESMYKRKYIENQRFRSNAVSLTQNFKRSAILHRKQPGTLRATYDDHLRLIGKHVLDFLLVLTELFSLCVTAEEL